MTSFIAIYRGADVTTAKLVAVSTDPNLVGYVCSHLLQAKATGATPHDPVLAALNDGRRTALQLIQNEGEDG